MNTLTSGRRNMIRMSMFLTLSCILSGCTPSVKVLTPDALKVDMNVRLDIYQQEAPKSKNEESSIEVAASRRERLQEILRIKASGIAGETRDGFLEMRDAPKDPNELSKDKKLIEDENTDRSVIYLTNAQTEIKPLEVIEQNYATLWRDRALPGEWVQGNDGQWKKK